MSKDAASKLVEFLQSRAGEYLRGAVHYTGDDYEVLYLRDDVEQKYSEADLDALFSYWRRRNAGQGDEPFSLGNLHSTVQLYDGGLLFHFTQGDELGTVITLDPEAGRDIVTFVTECLEQLHRHSPQTIANAPDWLDA